MAQIFPRNRDNELPGILPPFTKEIPISDGRTRGDVVVRPPIVAEHDTIIDDCMRSVTVDDVASGAIVDVYVNGVWRGSVGASTTFGGLTHVEVPLGVCSLRIGDQVQATQLVNGVLSNMSSAVQVVSHIPYSVLTQHYNNERTGWYQYARETWFNEDVSFAPLPPLTPSIVLNPSFGQKFFMSVDGKTYAQPLYMHHQFFPRLGTSGEAHNALFIATENDTVFAFDADNGTNLWQHNCAPSGFSPITSVVRSGDIPYPQGISSTPVISCGCGSDSNSASDCSCNCGDSSNINDSQSCACCRTATLYVVSRCQRNDGTGDGGVAGIYTFLHALDVTTGDERSNSPVMITASAVSPSGTPVPFLPRYQQNRPALLLFDGNIYVAFGGQEDFGSFKGWVMAYDAITLEQVSSFCAAPIMGGASIWQSGAGLASDGKAIYCATGNPGDLKNIPTPGGGDYGDSVLKFSPDLKLLSFFAPCNALDLHGADGDLSSGGPMVIPSPETGLNPNLLVIAGKDGQVILLNRDNLGGYDANPVDKFGNPIVNKFGNNPNAVDTALIRPGITLGGGDNDSGVWGAPAYYDGPDGTFIYCCGNGTEQTGKVRPQLVGFLLQNGKLKGTLGAMAADDIFLFGGGIPVVSSDGSAPGTGILWIVQRADSLDPSGPGASHVLSLRAYDPTTLSLLNHVQPNLPSGVAGSWDGRAFIEPTVINGRVYMAYGDPSTFGNPEGPNWYIGAFF